MHSAWILLLPLFFSCGDTEKHETGATPQDGDGDGYFGPQYGGLDCNDNNGDIYPGASEMCDAIDNDCDGDVDEYALDASAWYFDADGDGYGDPAISWFACDARPGYVGNKLDCDDSRYEVNPDGSEVCNELDDDCDGTVDEDAPDALTWYVDADGDGYGIETTALACSAPSGYADTPGDCDDALSTVFPGAEEVCNAIDDDCDNMTDEDAIDAATWYLDLDHDGFGDESTGAVTCSPGENATENNTDCDDANPRAHPDAIEICGNAVDEDCDGSDAGCAEEPDA